MCVDVFEIIIHIIWFNMTYKTISICIQQFSVILIRMFHYTIIDLVSLYTSKILTPTYVGLFNFITGLIFSTPTKYVFNICLCFKVGAFSSCWISSGVSTTSKSVCPRTSSIVLPYTALFMSLNKSLSKSCVASCRFVVFKSVHYCSHSLWSNLIHRWMFVRINPFSE